MRNPQTPRAGFNPSRDAAFMRALRADHGRLSRVLSEIDAEETRLRATPGASRALLVEAMRYVVEYQYGTHHPREDQLFARIAERSPKLRAEMRALMREHEGGLAQARRLAESLVRASDRALRGAAGARLARRLHDYVRHTREHMRHEERVFYDGAEKALVRADWKALAAAPAPPDPLADPGRLRREFPLLAQRIVHPERHAPGSGGPVPGIEMHAFVHARLAFQHGAEQLFDVCGDLLHDGVGLVSANADSLRQAHSPFALARALGQIAQRSAQFASRCVTEPAHVVAATAIGMLRAPDPAAGTGRGE